MVMDEAGRNGGKWHLAQQITQPVIRYVLSSTTIHIARNIIQTPTNHTPCNALYISTTSTTCNHTKTTIHTTCNSIITQIWGNFYFSYKYQKFSPIRYHNNLQFVNK